MDVGAQAASLLASSPFPQAVSGLRFCLLTFVLDTRLSMRYMM
jgi:hypothetical protein